MACLVMCLLLLRPVLFRAAYCEYNAHFVKQFLLAAVKRPPGDVFESRRVLTAILVLHLVKKSAKYPDKSTISTRGLLSFPPEK